MTETETDVLRIATFNANSINIRAEQTINIIERFNIDIIAIQETKTQDSQFPIDIFLSKGYNLLFKGQKSYNGVCFISKKQLEYACHSFRSNYIEPQQRFLVARYKDITLINCYVPNGGDVDSKKYNYKIEWLNNLHDYLKRFDLKREKVILLGDFNIAPEDIDTYDPEFFQGKTLCTDLERSILNKIKSLGFIDNYRYHNKDQFFSWWDYRANSFLRNEGLRIDLILNSSYLHKDSIACDIEKAPRSWDRPSDHTPVIATYKNK